MIKIMDNVNALIKYLFVPDKLFNVATHINDGGELFYTNFSTVYTDLTTKPWGCVCGYCKEANTVYLHSPNITESY